MFIIRDKEAGNEIAEFETEEEAYRVMHEYEEEDRNEGMFSEDFYEVVEKIN